MIRRGLVLPTAKDSDFLRFARDPVPFVRSVLGGDPWEEQERILRAVATFRRVAVRSCHHSGKTFAAAALVHWFVRAFDPSLVITTAPTDRQVRELLWYEVQEHQRRAGFGERIVQSPALTLEVSPTQRAFGFTTNEPERFQGWHCPNILVIVDEASGVPEPIYQAIEGVLTSANAHLLLIGNPNYPSGTFYEAFTSSLFEKFHISAYDVPERLLPPQWAAERRQEWGEDSPMYQVRVLGDFPEQGEDALISLRDIEAAQERVANAEGQIEIGCDVARYGGDESVAYVRQGARVLAADYWRGNDTMATAGRLVSLARSHAARVVKVDEIGVGAGVLDRLTEELKDSGVSVVGVNVGEAAWDGENYANRRAEIFAGLAQRFREGDISIPKDDLLTDQLVALRKTYTPRGQMKLPSKEDLRKERSASLKWRSPDRADALAICFAATRREFLWESY